MPNVYSIEIMLPEIWISKLVDSSQDDLKAPFSISTTPRCRRGRYFFPLIAPLTLDLYLIILGFKQGGLKYHFFSLWYDSAWDWDPVSRVIGKRSNHYTNGPSSAKISTFVIYSYAILFLFEEFKCCRVWSWILINNIWFYIILLEKRHPGIFWV